MTYTVAYIVGSLSTTSVNRHMVNAMIADAPEDLTFVEASYADLPLYSPEREADYPAEAARFKEIIEKADAVLIATPEYNRSIPGGLKNAIDWFSRPWGSNPIAGKPVYIVGSAMGQIGSALAQAHLRNTISFFNPLIMTQPEVYLVAQASDYAEDGRHTNEGTQGFLKSAIEEFAAYIRAHRG